MIPILTTALKFRMHLAVDTYSVAMIFTGAFGALGYIINGLSIQGSDLPPASFSYVNFIAWGCLAATSIAMAQVGARIAHISPCQLSSLAFRSFNGLYRAKNDWCCLT